MHDGKQNHKAERSKMKHLVSTTLQKMSHSEYNPSRILSQDLIAAPLWIMSLCCFLKISAVGRDMDSGAVVHVELLRYSRWQNYELNNNFGAEQIQTRALYGLATVHFLFEQ